jgi:hypothetical protein
MLLAELRYDRWGLRLDGFYTKLSKDAETPGPLFSNVDVTSQMGMGMLGPSLGYRASKSWVDPIVGLRLGAQLTDKILLRADVIMHGPVVGVGLRF